jgi:hypothetical protein
VPAARQLGSLSIVRGYARIDSRPDTAKIVSANRVEVHHARLLAVIGVRKSFPHGLGQNRKSAVAIMRSGLPPEADSTPTSRHVRSVPCVDGSGLARTFFTFCRLVGAAMCSAF